MDTKNQSTTKIPTVRTFAKDLELGRKNRKLSTGSSKAGIEKTIESNSKTLPATGEAIVIESEKTVGVTDKNDRATINQKSPLNKKGVPAIPRRDTFIVENEDSASATIITDTKHNRFKLAPAIKSSLSNWFTSKKDSYKASKIPKYTVPETTLRKGVIQRATSNTGRLTTSDFSSIHERIRNRKEKEMRPTATTTWSANTEPGFLLLENANNNIANVQMSTRRSFRTSPQEIVVTEINRNKKTVAQASTQQREFASPIVPFVETAEVATAEISPEIYAAAPTLTTEAAPNNQAPVTEANTSIVQETSADTYEIIEPTIPEQEIASTPNETYTEETIYENQNYEPRWDSERPAQYSQSETPIDTIPVSPETIAPIITEVETYTENTDAGTQNFADIEIPQEVEASLIEEVKKKGILSLNTNFLTLGVSSFALLVLIVIGGGYYWYNTQDEDNTISNETEIAQIINIPLEKMSVEDGSKESFKAALEKIRDENNEAAQVIFLSNNPNYDPIPPNILLSSLDIFLEQNFERSISALRFGFTKDKQPFVIIKTTNENVAKGGMLMWEKGMHEDLAEIFSFAEIDTNLNYKFTDSSLDETDLRVLKNEDDSALLIYGIKNNTVIITTNIFNFSELSRLTFK